MPRTTAHCRLLLNENGYTLHHDHAEVGRLIRLPDLEKGLELHKVVPTGPQLPPAIRGIELFRFARLPSGQWVAPHEIINNGIRMRLCGLQLQSVHVSPSFEFEKEPVVGSPAAAHGRSIVYLGYYLPDNTAVIQSLSDSLNAMGITHALLTFITCPSTSEPISVNYSMTNDFFNLSEQNRAILTDPSNSYTIGASFGGAFDMVSPLNSIYQDGSYYGGPQGMAMLAKDLAWACSPPVCSEYPCSFEYMVQQGDSCASIASDFHLTLDEFLSANQGLVCDPLALTMPYTVRQGDYCYAIAQEAGITLDELLQLNPGLNCSALHPGQVIQIPHYVVIPGSSKTCRTYTVQSGDTCSTIAKTNGVSLHDLLCANPTAQCGGLQVGQVLNIPTTTIPFPPTPPADGPFIKYIDLDLENIVASTQGQAQEFVDSIGSLCRSLRQVGFKTISHAPQPPYFTPSYNNVYLTLFQQHAQDFDFLNIQYYNNGPSQTFEEVFIRSDTSNPGTSILELIQRGISPSYLVAGKPSEPSQATNGGFIDLTTLAQYFQQAYSTKELCAWCAHGGAMIYYFSTTSLPTSQKLNQHLDPYITITYRSDDPPSMDDEVRQFFVALTSSPPCTGC